MNAGPQALTSIPEEMQPIFDLVEAQMGFVPNSFLTMLKRPQLLQAFIPLAAYIFSEQSSIEPALRQMAAYMSSYGSGCRYCQAHTSHGAEKAGLSQEKIANLWQFQSSELFDQREKAVCAFALSSGQTPNAVTPEHFAALGEHFSEAEIVDLVGVVSLFGFLNRWNDTMGTTLEDGPSDFAGTHLHTSGWDAGKHE